MFNAIKKYLANPARTSDNKKSFFDLASKHITKATGRKENISLNTDKVLYGK